MQTAFLAAHQEMAYVYAHSEGADGNNSPASAKELHNYSSSYELSPILAHKVLTRAKTGVMI